MDFHGLDFKITVDVNYGMGDFLVNQHGNSSGISFRLSQMVGIYEVSRWWVGTFVTNKGFLQADASRKLALSEKQLEVLKVAVITSHIPLYDPHVSAYLRR